MERGDSPVINPVEITLIKAYGSRIDSGPWDRQLSNAQGSPTMVAAYDSLGRGIRTATAPRSERKIPD